MNVSAFVAAMRIGRRDAWRNKGRSLLVLVLVGLPVLILTVVDVGWRTYQLTPEQVLTRQIGSADLAVTAGRDGVVQQSPRGWLDGGGYSLGPVPTTAPQTEATLLNALPARSRAIMDVTANAQLPIRAPGGVQYAPVIGLDYADPIARGLVVQQAGRAPRTSAEVAVTSRLAAAAALKVGSTMTVFDGSRTFTVVGIVHNTHNRSDQAIYTLPSVVTALNPAVEVTATWLLKTPAPVSWSQVLELNRLGFVAVSRQVYLNPPPASQIAYRADPSDPSTVSVTATALVIGMALLEIILMAGPAFAVTARRQRRDLALIAAVGGRRRDMRDVVLANGLVLGLTAGVLGVAGGIGICAGLLGLFSDRISTYPGSFNLHVLDLMGIALISLVTAVLAALLPAWTASRIDVLAALSGRRGQTRTRARTPIAGTVIAGSGVALALLGSAANFSVDLILAGVAVTEIGLIITTPALISLLARLGRALPFSPRLALRDAARNRSSTAPAVAAIMACMIGAIAVAVVTTSQADLSRREYRAGLPIDVAYTPVGDPQPRLPQPTAAQIQHALSANLATRQTGAIYAPDRPGCLVRPQPDQVCTVTSLAVSDPSGSTLPSLGRYQGSSFEPVIADDGTSVSLLLGQAVPQAEAALRAGTAVVTDPGELHGGKVYLNADSYSLVPLPSGSRSGPVPEPTHKLVAVPAVAVTDGFAAAQVILPTALATRLTHSPPRLTGVAAWLTQRPTTTQRQGVDKALAMLQPGLRIHTEDGFQQSTNWQLYALLAAAALIALGAATAATSLANVDGRTDLITLAAIGASPRSRRVISMSRATVIAGLGCLIGALAGLIPALAWIRHNANANAAALTSVLGHQRADSIPQLRFVVPWAHVVPLVIGIPLIATVISALTTRARLPSETPSE